ncbi:MULTISPECIES: zinc metallopeptidase [unclassified Deinococcus]|jgi:Zn-dependent membrane protease YugP|uniref:zinc metallopeptidase n=1 Tax=unclassified Deinococcus TaxID=2623546 RepID=UPI0006DC68DB|nr:MULTISPECIES: zinc metallopeptidase [unclassified Deinococcus]MCD0156466.1 zinc metallopeptidase [Deinococcus sp. 6GRE01]MCD0162782.1 zinc metallopeptidase [Deinococcus sp. 6YEL10]MCD0170219.1 zinc metallopeptidase [Deinococcus sp. 23YEL01]MCD0176863.1 zinc metallopeptidase [Deinococcus sp. 14RED07]PIG96026.1 flagellar biosynthesis protein FlgM [Deinococcus sp. UR1]
MEFLGPYTPLILLVFVASMLIQGYLTRTYSRWSQVRNPRNLTGADVARLMLDANGLGHVPVNAVPGNLSDHYDPIRKTVNLSQGVYGVPSVSAMAVAAHEVGHAIQDKVRMPALLLRGRLAVPLSLGMNLAPWLLMAGIVLQVTGLIWVGVILFGAALLFHLVTLPVEFDASRRALAYLEAGNLTGSPEGQKGAQAVLTAAALTYVAGFAMALAQFLNVLGMARNRS